MKALTVVACVLLLGVVAAVRDPAPKNRPISKVIVLLKDMQSALAKEQEDDEGVYDKLQCWCETNDKEKTKAIEQAEARIAELTSFIEEAAASISQLETEIKELEKEIAANHEALNQATAIRNKEREEFAATDKELTQAIGALKAAITVLSKHHAPPAAALINIATVVKHTLHKFGNELAHRLTHKQRRVINSFVQQPGFFGSSPTFKAAYAPQSSEVFGILNNMLDNFSADLKAAQEEEARRQSAYDDLKAAKEAQIAAAESAKDTKSQQLADTQEKLANAKQDIEDTRNSLGADQKYLMDLKLKCQQTDAEWAERQKTRAEELEAVSKAVSILSADDAHDLFTRTFNGGVQLIQTHAKVVSFKRNRAAQLLKRVAKRVNNEHTAELIQLASAVSLDAFERVKEAIDSMVVSLTKEKQDEIAHKDWCVKELNQNERQAEMKTRDRGDLQIKIDSLNQQIDALTKEVAVLEAEISDLQKQVQAAGEDREKSNLDFQATVKDAQETQKLLGQAIGVLQAFYAKGASLVQKQEPVGPPPPQGFSEYKNQSGSSGVVSMLEMILKDAATLEKEAIQAEQDAQAAYETFVKDSNASIEAKQRAITNRLETKALAEADLTEAKEDLSGVVGELEQLSSYAGQVHTACDFVLQNFDIRQAARDQEIEALQQAKAILSGMKSQ